MRKIIIGLIILLAVSTACSPRREKKVVEEYTSGQAKIVHHIGIKKGDTLLLKEVQYYASGQKKLKGEYFKNKKHGHWVFWYENGNTWSDGYFEKDLRVGKTLVYHPNGKLQYKGAYTQGKKSGVWIFYNAEGKQANKINFENGLVKSQSKE